MAGHFAIGHAVGRADALAESANATTAGVRDDSAVLSKATFVVDPSPGNEARFILHVAQDAFAEFLPALLWLTLILTLTLLLAWTLTKLWSVLLRQCGAPENWLRVTQLGLLGLLLFFGAMLGFGAVGVNFGQLFFGLSLVTAGAILSASDEIKNMATGVKLASLRVLTRHHVVRIPAYDLVGELIVLGVFTSEIRPLVADDDESESAGGGGGGAAVNETVLIDNRFILSGPLYVQWHQPRASARPPRFTATNDRRGGDVESGREARRLAPPAPTRRFEAESSRRVAPAAPASSDTNRQRARALMMANPSAFSGAIPATSKVTLRLGAAARAAVSPARSAAARHAV